MLTDLALYMAESGNLKLTASIVCFLAPSHNELSRHISVLLLLGCLADNYLLIPLDSSIQSF